MNPLTRRVTDKKGRNLSEEMNPDEIAEMDVKIFGDIKKEFDSFMYSVEEFKEKGARSMLFLNSCYKMKHASEKLIELLNAYIEDAKEYNK